MFLLVPAHPGFPGQIPQSRKTVMCVCVCFDTVGISHWSVVRIVRNDLNLKAFKRVVAHYLH